MYNSENNTQSFQSWLQGNNTADPYFEPRNILPQKQFVYCNKKKEEEWEIAREQMGTTKNKFSLGELIPENLEYILNVVKSISGKII